MIQSMYPNKFDKIKRHELFWNNCRLLGDEHGRLTFENKILGRQTRKEIVLEKAINFSKLR